MTSVYRRLAHIPLLTGLLFTVGLSHGEEKKPIQLPAPNVELRASLDGKYLTTLQDIARRGPQGEKRTAEEIEKYSVKLKLDQSIQLKVELIEQGKPPVDVTRSPFIHYSTGARWALTVTPTGLVTARPEKDWVEAAEKIGRTGYTTVWVAYEEGQKLGLIVIPITVTE